MQQPSVPTRLVHRLRMLWPWLQYAWVRTAPRTARKTQRGRQDSAEQALLRMNLCVRFPSLKDSIVINSTAFEDQDAGHLAFIGSKTESALLGFARTSLRMGPVRLERSNSRTVFLLSFDSRRKYMATIVQRDCGFRIYAKGAAEVVLGRCTQILHNVASNASATAITPEDIAHLNLTIRNFTTRSLRTIALLYRDLQSLPYHSDRTTDEVL